MTDRNDLLRICVVITIHASAVGDIAYGGTKAVNRMHLHASSLFIPFGVNRLMGKKRQKPIKKYARNYLKDNVSDSISLSRNCMESSVEQTEQKPYRTLTLRTATSNRLTTGDATVDVTPTEIKDLDKINVETLEEAARILHLPAKPVLLKARAPF
eukprot:gb/GECG01010445.1/.p1 GENE.gb/GECG01010445.1/~~gb/GECG01010445.1/.p1  ORF type:complete len:156 (+),score=15.83 gb/GECG01010445.1/:1-468(+)